MNSLVIKCFETYQLLTLDQNSGSFIFRYLPIQFVHWSRKWQVNAFDELRPLMFTAINLNDSMDK